MLQPYSYIQKSKNIQIYTDHGQLDVLPLSQWLHVNNFSPVCVLTCLIRLHLFEKALSHWSHLYGLSTECILTCVIRLIFCEKDMSQWVHLYGFSPVCVLICCDRLVVSVKALSHWSHLYGFSPECILLCLVSIEFWAKDIFTLAALKLFLSSVYPSVTFKITNLRKSFITMCTLV